MVLASLLFSSPAWSAGEETGPGRVQVAWRLLDYVAVDYPEAVRGGRIVNEAEYAEMLEFSAAAARHVSELPAHAAKADLLARSSALMAAVREKRDPQEVARLAKALGSQLLRAFPVPLAPSRTPDLTRGAAIYQEQCAACHGRTGDGKGPEAAGLDPPPIAFADRARAAQRSVFALEQVINQGLEGTEMKSFAQLSPEDRWAVAMHVSRLSFFPSEVAEGERLWSSDRSLRQRVPDLQALVSLTPVTLADELGDRSKAEAVIAFLRSHPEALQATVAGSLSLTRDRLAQSLEAYRSGHRGEARQLALSAYLDGFEPVEPTLSARDGRLMRQIEQAMARLRELIGSGAPVSDVEAQVATLDHLFAEAETILADDRGTDLSAGISSFTILLREGLEALLVVVAMIAFLRKAERTEVMPYVHAGWVAALAAGAATWLAATTLIEISGASRELTEGFGGLFAAVVLISVGIWMHGKAQAGAWQQYIAEKLDRALSRKSAWFLFMLAFVVVYREVFETILFFAAMWAPGREGAILGGALSGAVALAAIAWAMLRYSHALPIGTFFRYSSWLLAVLAVTLAGKGVAALQEAGTFGVTTLDWVPQFDVFGLYPTLEVVVAQLVAVFALVFGFRFGSRPHPRADQDRA
ncbi:MAG: iron permease [Sphingomonadales bacterium 12-68-11]|nr:MAG: iron permease [Sphingomonadales bacterium 12-68-11]